MNTKKILNILICLSMSLVLFSCSTVDKNTIEETKLETIELAEDDYVVYEGIFLDNQEVLDIFKDIRGEEAPYAILPSDYHVTTAFLPDEENTNYSLYGQKVKVHIIGYKCGKVVDDDGLDTHNEGLLVEVSSDNNDVQTLLESLNNTWHITGSSEEAAKYTGKLDFSNVKTLDITIEGTFGAYLNSKVVTLNPVQR